MKPTLRLALLAIAASVAAAPAFAQSQSTMNATAARSAAAADQALNAQYARTISRLSPPARTQLRNAQRAWIGFRDLECKFEGSGVQGGSAYPMVYSGCLERMTAERTRQLKTLAQCEEGDLSCPR